MYDTLIDPGFGMLELFLNHQFNPTGDFTTAAYINAGCSGMKLGLKHCIDRWRAKKQQEKRKQEQQESASGPLQKKP